MAGKESIACKTNLERLQSLHHQALRQCRMDIDRWAKYKADYEAVQARLVELPEKYAYDVMVPLGNQALMPGQIIHTNEVLVSLGDNWFAHCSAKQSVDIITRRLKYINEELTKFAQQLKDLEARVEFTSDFNETLHEGILEIREECSDEEQHDPTVRRSRHRVSNRQQKRSGEEHQSHEDIMAQLDELEKEEALYLEDIEDSQKNIEASQRVRI
jgi:unconventional prefoldin RPB5 interactor 1